MWASHNSNSTHTPNQHQMNAFHRHRDDNGLIRCFQKVFNSWNIHLTVIVSKCKNKSNNQAAEMYCIFVRLQSETKQRRLMISPPRYFGRFSLLHDWMLFSKHSISHNTAFRRPRSFEELYCCWQFCSHYVKLSWYCLTKWKKKYIFFFNLYRSSGPGLLSKSLYFLFPNLFSSWNQLMIQMTQKFC